MKAPFDVDQIPSALQSHARWLLWMLDGAGKKAPRQANRPDRNCDATKSTSWTTFAKAADAATRHSHGVGFALGPVDNGPTFAGVDLDTCRNPDTGDLEEWAQQVIRYLDSYTEVSPSGTGVKIFLHGALPAEAKQGKVYKCEIYDRQRYFTVTGNHLAGTPTTVEARADQLRDLHDKLWGDDLVTLTRIFGFFIEAKNAAEVSIWCPWADHHSTPSKPGDCGLRVTNGRVDGFHCFHAGCQDKTLGDLLALFGIRGNRDFIVSHTGQILKGEPDNIRRALTKLGYELSFDRFAERVLAGERGTTAPLTEAHYDRMWFAINETFQFLPPTDLFHRVVADQARARSFHPVLDYLDAQKWDGQLRLDTWLVTYGGANDTPYTRAVGALTLMAAVRRVRQPGCKFDEMLVLESKQGTNKSTALSTLCPNPDWFSDDLALGLDSQEVIERTGGKWLIEAAELRGIRLSETERLKSFMSRSADGPARRAYGRISEERPRQFIFIGTTNSSSYLRDSTGNRRYWPVTVGVFDVFNLRRDRDQLWAEAAVREAEPGETVRLPEHLWPAAAAEQEARRQDDPWEEPLLDALADNEVVEVGAIWTALAPFGASPSNNTHTSRVADMLERNGYARPRGGVRRINGKPTRCWIKATSPLLKGLEQKRDEDAPIPRPHFVKPVSDAI